MTQDTMITAARQRMSCADCGAAIRTAIWCEDPACCGQDLVTVLAALAAEQQQTGVPTFLVRFLEDPAGPSAAVRVWAPGSIAPVYTGPANEAQGRLMPGHGRDDLGG